MVSWNNWLKNHSLRLDKSLIIYFKNNDFFYNKLLDYKGAKILSVGSGRGIHERIITFLGLDVTFSDCDKNILKRYDGKKRYVDILKKKVYSDVVFTDGLLEHFVTDELFVALENMCGVSVMFHQIPIMGAKSKNFGNEIYRPHKDWMRIFKFVYPLATIEVYPVSHSNIFFYLFRKIFSLEKYSSLPLELSFSGTNLYIIKNK